MKNHKKTMLIKALFVMLLWGSLIPMVKLSYKAMNINTASPASILMFAGIRFAICGAVITAYSALKKERLCLHIFKSLLPVAMMGLFSVVLHYACTYIGLTITDSSKAAILKQTGALFYICFSFLFIKDETFEIRKLAGALVGFLGIVVINAGQGGAFSAGDALILCASICTVASNLFSKQAMKANSSTLATGVSQLFGGAVLMVAAALMGGEMPVFSLAALPLFGYICIASIVSYCMWFAIVKNDELSGLFIIKFSEPVFAAIFGALLLHEDILKWQYGAAFVLISLGILMSHLKKVKAIPHKCGEE